MKFKTNLIIATILAVIFFWVIPSLNWDRGIFSFLYNEKQESCETINNLTLKSVSGIEDIDKGLLSGGTIYRKVLLFENGLIIDLKESEIKSRLILGNNYNYTECKIIDGGIIIIPKWERMEKKLE